MKNPKSIHLASTNCRMHTRQGIKYYCYCGVHMFVDSDRWTDAISKVTCKRCKADYNRIIKNNQIQSYNDD